MSVLGINIKKIRSVKGLNQTDFANLFGLTRANIGSYEELRAEPKIDTIIKIATYYKLPIDKLVRKELTVNEISNFTALNELVIQNTNKKEGSLYVTKEFLEEYPSKKQDKFFLNQIPRIIFPFGSPKTEKRVLFNDGNQLFFNNSGFLHGDLLFMEKINLTKNKPDCLGVVVDSEFIYKGVLELEESSITITPLNPNLPKGTVALNKKTEVWKIVGKYSSEVISNTSMTTKLAVLQKKLDKVENK